MSFRLHAASWPEAYEIFPGHAEQDILPTVGEVELKFNALLSLDQDSLAHELELWWDSLPESETAQRLYPSWEVYPESAPPPKLRDFILPLGVILLVLGFIFSSVIITTVSRIDSSANGETRLDRFPREPVVVASAREAPEQKISEKDMAPRVTAEHFEEVHLYRINDDLTLSPNPTASVAELWTNTVAVFGNDARELNSFGVAYGEDRNSIAAYIQISRKSLVLNLDRLMVSSIAQQYTLIHEYNHLVTLQGSGWQENCDAPLLNGASCVAPDSSLREWISLFWNSPAMLEGVSTGDLEAGQRNYTRYPGEFVTIYAASAPQEDMAESFAAWVLDYELPQAKKDFFNGDGESLALKDRIKKSLAKL